MVKKFIETQKRAQKGKIIDYPVKNIEITDWQTAIIHYRKKNDLILIRDLLRSMQGGLAVDDGFAPDFSLEVKESENTIIVTGNTRNCFILLRHKDDLSPIFANDIFNWFREFIENNKASFSAEDSKKIESYNQSFTYYQKELSNSDTRPEISIR